MPQIGRVLAQGVVGCWIFEFRCLGFDLLRSFWGFGVCVLVFGLVIKVDAILVCYKAWAEVEMARKRYA